MTSDPIVEKIKIMTLKQFVYTEALRYGVTPGRIYSHINHGGYPGLELERINQRVIYVVKPVQRLVRPQGRQPKKQRDL